jgi:hypothetical protein
MGQWVQWALLYWSEDDKLLKKDANLDFLDAPQSAKTTSFCNIWSKTATLMSLQDCSRLEQSNKASVLVIYNGAVSRLDKDKG